MSSSTAATVFSVRAVDAAVVVGVVDGEVVVASDTSCL